MKNSNDTSGIEHVTFRQVALLRAPHEFVNMLFTIPSYTTQFHWKYKYEYVVYDGLLNKYVYWVENNVDVSPEDSYEFSYWQLKIYKKPNWLVVLC